MTMTMMGESGGGGWWWLVMVLVGGTMRQVVLSFWLMESRRSITWIVFLVSRSPVGSSSSRITGSLASARAIALIFRKYVIV